MKSFFKNIILDKFLQNRQNPSEVLQCLQEKLKGRARKTTQNKKLASLIRLCQNKNPGDVKPRKNQWKVFEGAKKLIKHARLAGQMQTHQPVRRQTRALGYLERKCSGHRRESPGEMRSCVGRYTLPQQFGKPLSQTKFGDDLDDLCRGSSAWSW